MSTLFSFLKRSRFSSTTGLTIVELLMVISVFVILVTGLTVFVGRSFEISREQFEQVRITDDARFQMERIGDAIRDAQFVDCNGDGETNLSVEHWLQLADENSIMFYTNFDDDEAIELVRYFTEPEANQRKNMIHRGITQLNSDCTSAGNEEVVLLMQTLRNPDKEPPVPLFRYFKTADDSSEMFEPINLTSVKRVRLQLVVDESEKQFPTDASLATDLVPRSVECDKSEGCGPLACLDPGEAYSEYYFEDDFALLAYNDCLDHCATNGNIPEGQCCSWSATLGLAYDEPFSRLVGSACQCGSVSYSGTPTDFPNPNVEGQYTDFARECLDGTRCEGVSGKPVCNAGCLTEPGECYCECPA